MLKSIVDSLKDVDEKYHDLYTEKNGKFEFSGVEGLKTQGDIDRLQTALTKERGDHKAVRDRLSLLGDHKIEDVLVQLDRLPELEAAAKGKIDEKQIESMVEGRIRTKLAPIERERDQFKAKSQESEGVIAGYVSRDRVRAIHDTVRVAASQSKILPEAIDDALMHAERVFEVSEDGKVTTRDGVGVTPGVEASVWFTELQTKRPHWWGPSQGGGAGGNRGGPQGGSNPWTEDGWNMTEQGKIFSENPARANQLAKSAGTTVGGPKPKAKK